MFQFTTTTIINGNKYGKADAVQTITNKGLKDGEVADVDVMSIRRTANFQVDDLHELCYFKTEGHEAYLDTLNVEGITGVEDTPCRLALYIRSIGNADPIHANDFVFKGRPIFVEFDGSMANLHENLNKYLNVTFDRPILLAAKSLEGTATDGDASTVVAVDELAKVTGTGADKDSDIAYIVCANEYMRITRAEVQVWVEEDTDTKVSAHWSVDAKEGSIDLMPYVSVGAEGFGTFEHLEKDFRLPTQANLRWRRPMSDDVPAPGTLYNEYVLHYKVKRGQVGGMGAVGELITSTTTHVIWADEATSDALDSALSTIGATEGKIVEA